MEKERITTISPELEHPADGQYVWLPLLVFAGVVLLAGLVYIMSRSRHSFNCNFLKRRNTSRNGYSNVDEGDSDVSMVGASDFEESNAITSLLDSRLQIATNVKSNTQSSQVHLDADDIALRV